MNNLLETQFHFYERIGVNTAWLNNIKGDSLKIAVIDSGIPDNDFFPKSRLIDNINLTEENHIDTLGHGSHIAGLIFGEHINDVSIGLLPKAKFFIIKTVGKSGKTSVHKIIEALHIILDYNLKKPSSPIDLVNISLGNSIYSEDLHLLVRELYDKKTLIVASAGNLGDLDENTTEISYPGVFCECIQIGACDRNLSILNLSNSNINLDFVSLGDNVVSNDATAKGLQTLSGTSMATALSSGVIGMYIDFFKNKGCKDPTSEAICFAKKNTLKLPQTRLSGRGLLQFKIPQ